MKGLFAALLGSLLLVTATPAVAKVCYRCQKAKPVKYVCARRDTFAARKNARKLGCNWRSYSSSCKCGAWVNHRRGKFVDYALSLFP